MFKWCKTELSREKGWECRLHPSTLLLNSVKPEVLQHCTFQTGRDGNKRFPTQTNPSSLAAPNPGQLPRKRGHTAQPHYSQGMLLPLSMGTWSLAGASSPCLEHGPAGLGWAGTGGRTAVTSPAGASRALWNSPIHPRSPQRKEQLRATSVGLDAPGTITHGQS